MLVSTIGITMSVSAGNGIMQGSEKISLPPKYQTITEPVFMFKYLKSLISNLQSFSSKNIYGQGQDAGSLTPINVNDGDMPADAGHSQAQQSGAQVTHNCNPGSPCTDWYQLPGGQWVRGYYDSSCHCVAPTAGPGNSYQFTFLENDCSICPDSGQAHDAGSAIPFNSYDGNGSVDGPVSPESDDDIVIKCRYYDEMYDIWVPGTIDENGNCVPDYLPIGTGSSQVDDGMASDAGEPISIHDNSYDLDGGQSDDAGDPIQINDGEVSSELSSGPAQDAGDPISINGGDDDDDDGPIQGPTIPSTPVIPPPTKIVEDSSTELIKR